MAQLRVAPGGEHVLPKEPPQTGGFDFGLAARNARLAAAAGATASMPEPMSTGTTICGVVYAGGVVLGADTRATGGSEVADCVEIKIYGAFVLNHRVVLHAIDATPARRRGGVNSSPLDRARTAALSPRNDLVKNYRVNPTH